MVLPADVVEFARAFQHLLEHADEMAMQGSDSQLAATLADHLAVEAGAAPVIATTFPGYEHATVDIAMSVLAEELGGSNLIGVSGQERAHLSFADLVGARAWGVGIGAVDYVDLPVSPDEVRACVQCGLHLLRWEAAAVAVLVRGPSPATGRDGVSVEVMAVETDASQALLRRLRELLVIHDVIRGQVVTFEPARHHGPGTGPISFLRRPHMGKDELVLPSAIVELVERQASGVARRRERLLASGQHLKRGLLLHGPPGTGKTHTVRYLMGRLEEFTVVVLSGTGLQLIGAACSVARRLQPAMIVLEDCDLVAQDRDMFGTNPLLFTVLNEMDGLGSEADVLFVLTTNRADVLEHALVERPGRIDQAIEIALPDLGGRRELLALYSRGATLADDVDLDDLAGRTEGVTASYIKELVRRAVLHTALLSHDDASERVVVTRTAFDAALAELQSGSADLTRALLGGRGGTFGGTGGDPAVPGLAPLSGGGPGMLRRTSFAWAGYRPGP